MKNYGRIVQLGFLLFSISVGAAPSRPALDQLEKLKEQGLEEKWTFTTGYSPVMDRTLAESTGLVQPSDWDRKAMFVRLKPNFKRALPDQFDWRQQSQGLPPIKDQKSCLSCWAFATTGVFESVLKIREWKNKNLSEQYLVSCNQEGYSCQSGGWWAHQYHKSPGSVSSSSFPYVAQDVPCKASLAHGDKVASWAYVASSGGTQSKPSVEQIKKAIFEYGPVAVAVYADNAFRGYTSGTFNACHGTEPTHAVVLVGWDDRTGTWILRNSWGTQWGERGYMNIKYGCNGVGRAASYVVYKARCAPTADAGQDVVVHPGQSVRIGSKAIGGHRYHWTPEEGLDDAYSATPIATPKGDTVYTLTADTDCGSAEHRATVSVN